jgi:NAD(P)-dependent dehydrogenase (short-subunit alcohol dehydrogenase family)
MTDAGRVLITGASGGAGGGVIASFLEAGWKVAGVTRHVPPDDPGAVHWIRADLVDAQAAKRMVADAVAALGGLDALVCLAGGYSSAKLEELSWADFEKQIGTSLRPTVESVLAALPALRRSEAGAIVTIGAQTALKPGRNAGPYAAAKAAVATWSLSLAAGLKSAGVRVNCVLPGTLDTGANRESMPDAKRDAWVDPRDFGNLIAFLCSPASRPLTGATIPIG